MGSSFERVTNLVMSLAFLVVVVGLVWLVGTGRLDLGIDPSLVFLVYVIAGLLTAFACFGVLTSTGELSGGHLGTNVRLGGSIVAAVLVAGGGSLYELYVRPSGFSTRILFYETSPANPVSVAGTLALFIGSGVQEVPIQGDGTALFQNLNKPARLRYALRSTAFEIDPAEREEIVPARDGLVTLKVRRKNPFESYDTSKLKINFERALTETMGTGDRVVTIRLILWSDSERPIPLRAAATLSLTKSGLPVRTLTADVAGDTLEPIILVKPHIAQALMVRAIIGSDYEQLMGMGLDVSVTLQYADKDKADGGHFETEPIPFSEDTFVGG